MRNRSALLGMCLIALLLGAFMGVNAAEIGPAFDGARHALFERQGYVGPVVGTCVITYDENGEVPVCVVEPAPLLPLGACDNCNKTGELVCGVGQVDESATKKTTSIDGGKGCEGKCKEKNGQVRYWAASCPTPAPIQPKTIVDEPDPAGNQPRPIPMLEK